MIHDCPPNGMFFCNVPRLSSVFVFSLCGTQMLTNSSAAFFVQSFLLCTLEVCQKFYKTGFSGHRFCTLKTRTSQLFSHNKKLVPFGVGGNKNCHFWGLALNSIQDKLMTRNIWLWNNKTELSDRSFWLTRITVLFFPTI